MDRIPSHMLQKLRFDPLERCDFKLTNEEEEEEEQEFIVEILDSKGKTTLSTEKVPLERIEFFKFCPITTNEMIVCIREEERRHFLTSYIVRDNNFDKLIQQLRRNRSFTRVTTQELKWYYEDYKEYIAEEWPELDPISFDLIGEGYDMLGKKPPIFFQCNRTTDDQQESVEWVILKYLLDESRKNIDRLIEIVRIAEPYNPVDDYRIFDHYQRAFLKLEQIVKEEIDKVDNENTRKFYRMKTANHDDHFNPNIVNVIEDIGNADNVLRPLAQPSLFRRIIKSLNPTTYINF